ncbi:MAG: SDR family oxidoreductase [Bdellovibrionales bacterium]|nr:SDR family oxidoreductase [Bdellovibrionales bacterium]
MSYLDQLFNLEGKVAAVTGGGGMLCGEMARAFGKAGCQVAIMDSRLEKAERVASQIREAGGKAIALEHQALSKESFQNSLDQILQSFGHCDILINGAGINAPTPLMEINETEWDEIIGVHLKGTLFGCQVFGKHMLRRGSGSILNLSSASSGPPLSKAFTYSVAKAGIKNLTQNIAREWGTSGVRVNSIKPGFFPTQWSIDNFITEERQAAIWGHTRMKRYGKVEELVGAVLWVNSDAASFVTGSEIAVDGGFSCMTI